MTNIHNRIAMNFRWIYNSISILTSVHAQKKNEQSSETWKKTSIPNVTLRAFENTTIDRLVQDTNVRSTNNRLSARNSIVSNFSHCKKKHLPTFRIFEGTTIAFIEAL